MTLARSQARSVRRLCRRHAKQSDAVFTLGAGLAAFAALVYTARNYALSRESQVTDRYTKAIEQLGSKELDIRIGGIYALERIARDSARDHPVVMEVLQTFVREHSPAPFVRASEAEQGAGGVDHMQADIQAAVTVIGRRNYSYDRGTLDLYGTDLSRLILTDETWAARTSPARNSRARTFPARPFLTRGSRTPFSSGRAWTAAICGVPG